MQLEIIQIKFLKLLTFVTNSDMQNDSPKLSHDIPKRPISPWGGKKERPKNFSKL